MRSLSELLSDDPAFPLVRQWAADAAHAVELLAPSPNREQALLETQVTTRSPLGAVAYETGGILVSHGWVRLLGSGHDRLRRTLPAWNQTRSKGFYLVADDAIGGFFATNGGAFGSDTGNVYYFAPDTLDWEPLHFGYSGFLQWIFSSRMREYYGWISWPGCDADVKRLQGDRCYFFAPPLFTVEGRKDARPCGDIPVEEAWGLQMDYRQQFPR